MSHHTAMVQTLRATGHRLTPQRESVLAVIADSHVHLTAEEILRRARERYPYLNKSAVYRSLGMLTQIGLVTQTDCGRGRIEYELHQHPHHHHLICRDCHKTLEVEHALFAALEKNLLARYGFQADLDHFAIFGHCRKCQSKKK
jgi:Fur family ferric uptake transcriptional regulator